jgi:ankyrin repeat protein
MNSLSFSAHDEFACDEEQRPILGVCRNRHVEVVRLLLAHGADTCQPVLETAVRYGQFGVPFLLLQHGAEKGV